MVKEADQKWAVGMFAALPHRVSWRLLMRSLPSGLLPVCHMRAQFGVKPRRVQESHTGRIASLME